MGQRVIIIRNKKDIVVVERLTEDKNKK